MSIIKKSLNNILGVPEVVPFRLIYIHLHIITKAESINYYEHPEMNIEINITCTCGDASEWVEIVGQGTDPATSDASESNFDYHTIKT
jgi:hypothetical protein